MILQTRSLNAQFKKYRENAKNTLPSVAAADRDAEPLLQSSLGATKDVEMGESGVTAPTPLWLVRAEKIRTEFKSVKEKLTKLKEAHTKAIVVTFNSDDDAQSHVDALTKDMQITFRKLDSEIKSLPAGSSSDDQQVQSQVQQQLAQALLKLSIEFRQEQKRYLNNVETQKGIAAGSSLQALGLEDEPAEQGAMADLGFTSNQVASVDTAVAVALERDEQITKIVETISELATIMRDLSTLVVEQGTMLDRIDKNIEKVAEHVEEGVKELVRAENTQKSGRMMMCIIVMCVIIAVLFIIVLIRHG